MGCSLEHRSSWGPVGGDYRLTPTMLAQRMGSSRGPGGAVWSKETRTEKRMEAGRLALSPGRMGWVDPLPVAGWVICPPCWLPGTPPPSPVLHTPSAHAFSRTGDRGLHRGLVPSGQGRHPLLLHHPEWSWLPPCPCLWTHEDPEGPLIRAASQEGAMAKLADGGLVGPLGLSQDTGLIPHQQGQLFSIHSNQLQSVPSAAASSRLPPSLTCTLTANASCLVLKQLSPPIQLSGCHSERGWASYLVYFPLSSNAWQRV